MQVSKGAPLRAFSIIIMFWILVRITWESVTPSEAMLGTETEKLTGIPAHLGLPPLWQAQTNQTSAMLRSRNNQTQSAAMLWSEGRRVAEPIREESISLPPLANGTRTPKAASMENTALVPSPHNISQMQADVVPSSNVLSQSSNPLSGYFWAFVRQGSGSGRFGSAAPILQSPGGQYGGSQAGAILTYRLAGSQQRNLSAFVRASTAISDAGEEEIAIGIRARPFAKIPLSLFAEQRIRAGQLRSRGTSVYVAGGTGPDRVLTDTYLDTYGQAGFLFASDSSHFFDASANLQRELLKRGKYKLTAGAGVWAGGQQGLRRLDIGPRANIHIPVATADVQFSLDWRQRIGGNAAPDSGVAVTVTTGF